MNGLGSTDSGEVAVALIGEHEIVGIEARHCSSHSRRTAMSRLHPVDINIIICKNGASHRSYAHGFIGSTHFGEHLGNEAVNHTVAAARTVVCIILCKQLRTAVYFIFGPDNIFGFHCRVV